MTKVSNRYGRKTFDFMLGQFRSCYNELSPFFMRNDETMIVQKEHLATLRIIRSERSNIDIKNWVRMDISYIIVFMGLSKPGQKAIRDVLNRRYNEKFVGSILYFLSKKPHQDSKYYNHWLYVCKNELLIGSIVSDFSIIINFNDDNLSLLKKKDGLYYKYYGGHQYKLSHYYRHLYQTVKYINEQAILTSQEKQDYMSFLRSQLSTPEQMLFFINSISSLGQEWELKEIIKQNTDNFLITKYNLIRNITDLSIDGITDIKSFYPGVAFQFAEQIPTSNG